MTKKDLILMANELGLDVDEKLTMREIEELMEKKKEEDAQKVIDDANRRIELEKEMDTLKQQKGELEAKKNVIKYENELLESKIRTLKAGKDIFDENDGKIQEIKESQKTISENNRQAANHTDKISTIEVELFELEQEHKNNIVKDAQALIVNIIKLKNEQELFIEEKVSNIFLDLAKESEELNSNINLKEIELKKMEINLGMNFSISEAKLKKIKEDLGLKDSVKNRTYKLQVEKALRDILKYLDR